MNLDYLYIGLLKGSELGLVEISQEGTNYRRIEMGPFDWCFQDGILINVYDIRFNTATSEWGLVTHFGVFNSLQGENILVVGNLDLNSVTCIHKGIQIQFEAGKITVEIKALGLEIENA